MNGSRAALLALLAAGCEQAHLPEDISTHGHAIDHLFWLIMGLTALAFVGTEALLVYSFFKFRRRPGGRSEHTHGNHLVEMIWTIVPGIVLFFLAIYQIPAWDKAKVAIPADTDENVLPLRVFAKQFEWNFQYPGPDGRFDTDDDAYATGNLVIPVDTKIRLHMRTYDVLHSFFIPYLRFKQDLVPGMEVPGWFMATQTTAMGRARRAKHEGWRNFNYEIACAELCGLGHGKMRSLLTILPKDEFQTWLRETSAKYHRKTGDLEPPPIFADNAWQKALTYGDPNKLYRQAGPGEPGFVERKEH